MAKKIKEEMADVIEEMGDVVEAVEEAVVEVATDAKEAVEEFITEKLVEMAKGAKVEIIDFYVRAFNGLKGIVTGQDENGNTLIELDGGTQASFKPENLTEVK